MSESELPTTTIEPTENNATEPEAETGTASDAVSADAGTDTAADAAEDVDLRMTAPSREELLESIRECYNESGQIEPPTIKEAAEYADLSTRPFERADNWNTLLSEAGIPTLAELCDEWIAAYIEQGYGTSREFRTSRIHGDLDAGRNRIARAALQILYEETEEERVANRRKVDVSRREDVGEHSPVIWVGSLRDPDADPTPTHLRDAGGDDR